MKNTIYSQQIMEIGDMKKLQKISLDYLNRNSYMRKFKHLLLSITLCQGAANHYAVCQGKAKKYYDPKRNGLKDIDIWFFFGKDKELNFNCRWIGHSDFGPSKFGKNPQDTYFLGRRIDFLGRSIEKKRQESKENIIEWLRRGNAGSPKLLAQKVIVGLYPKNLFNEFLWINKKLNT